MTTFNANPTAAQATRPAAGNEPPLVQMEIHRGTKRAFMEKYDRYEPVVKDHTQVITFKTCPRMYFYQIVLGRVPKDEAVYFAWGSAYHKFRYVLEVAYGLNSDKPKMFDESRAADALTKAVNEGMSYWKRYGKDQPLDTKWEFMTGERLLRTFMAAFQHWTKEKKQGRIEVLAVEQLFNVLLPDGQRTSGRADQIVRWNYGIWGRDFKTTSKPKEFRERLIEPNDQFTRYTFAEAQLCGEPVQGQIIEFMYNAKSTKKEQKGPEIDPVMASRSQWQIDQWVRDEKMWRQMIDLAREEDVYPMTEVSCPFCPYHSVCKQSSETSMMAQLEANYTVRPWDNTKIGVDDR